MIATNADLLIPPETVARAVAILLAATPQGSRVILFGSYARGEANSDSDLDFLVVEPTLTSRRARDGETALAVAPLGVPADVLVVSRQSFDAWKSLPNNVINEASTEGKVYEYAS